ncbi:hypothetical protein LCGC14_1100170, partial [marine sediment metagenome]
AFTCNTKSTTTDICFCRFVVVKSIDSVFLNSSKYAASNLMSLFLTGCPNAIPQ